MHIWIGVEDFAKIERAKVCMDQYTLFVGPNNSGKTFLMQLIQGLSDKIVDFLEEDAMDILLAEQFEGYCKYVINQDNIGQLLAYINDKLNQKKEQLVREIFGREISIGKLYIDLELEEGIFYQIDLVDGKSLEIENIKKSKVLEEIPMDFLSIDRGTQWMSGFLSKRSSQEGTVDWISIAISAKGSALSAFRIVLRHILESDSLFLPASRTGLMLLYRDFFANRADDAVSYRVSDSGVVGSEGWYGGLTQPVYGFLRFLQTYFEKEENIAEYKKELDFFEDNIIEGHISVKKQGDFSYQAKDGSSTVPMYLASAMVNEVTPLVLALTSEKRYGRLIIDEVEASLHPQKQLEMARFLNRIHNKGMKLVLSTHSDTFVSKLNNLYVLSEQWNKQKKEEAEKRFHVEPEDLISAETLFVYEFVFQDDGRSIVKEIVPDPKMGFKFDLFTKPAMELYEEALRIGENH